ncbi:Tetratricopeptide repeat protein [Paramyrothecium foliicola]|nr:Tetratricopeptide repeat protein [Paramyrothecium foliicola]
MASAAEVKTLSANDNSVLAALFDSEASLTSPATKICDIEEPRLPNFNDYQVRTLQKLEAEILKPLNETRPPRQGIEKAIVDLDELIKAFPEYPSAYANRAQAQRLLLEETEEEQDISRCDPTQVSIIRATLADLSTAINLATPHDPNSSVSPLQAQVLAKAHTHRGYILHKLTKKETRREMAGTLGLGDFQSLEELASRDFYQGGVYGNDIAKQLSVLTNPYAKLCGAIVKEALMEDIVRSLV